MSLLSLVIGAVCFISLVLGGGVAILMMFGEKDGVSNAREDWISGNPPRKD